MKILRLDLRAFGRFTGTVLDLSGGRQGLHLIYGPNEAGKSTALRALVQLLYGIPERTTDRFLHDYDRLRIGATLKRGDRELTFLRRKGRGRTLRCADDTSDLDPDALDWFLDRLDEGRFRSLFGIDHPELVAGGRQVAAGGGDLGELVFGSGTDLKRLRDLQKRLEDEQTALFKPKGENPPLNRDLSALKEARRAVEDASLRSVDWHQHQTALDDARRERDAIDLRLAVARRERSRLERIERALPDVGHRRELLSRLEELADAPRLRDGFPAERARAMQDLRDAECATVAAEDALRDLSTRLASLEGPGPILDEADRVEALHRRLGGHQQDLEELATLRAERAALRDRARSILRDLGRVDPPDGPDSPRLTAAQRARVRALATDFAACVKECEATSRTLDARERAVELRQAELLELRPPRDPGPLGRLVDRIQRSGDLEARLDEARREETRLARQASAALKKLAPWPGPIEEADLLPIPSQEAVDVFERDLEIAESVARASAEKLAKHEEELADLESRIEARRRVNDVPTEADLSTAREVRDLGWRLVRGAWLDGLHSEAEAQFSGTQDLPTAFERSILRADELADRMRRESAKVAELTSWGADLDRGRARLGEIRTARDRSLAQRDQILARWRQAWSATGIEPRSPREMSAWLRDHARLVEKVEEIRRGRVEAEAIGAEIERARAEFRAPLRDLGEVPPRDGETLAALIDRARAVLENVESIEAERRSRAAAIRDAEDAREEARCEDRDARRALADLRATWTVAVAPLGLAADAPPAAAESVLGLHQALDEVIQKSDSCDRRIAQIEAAGRRLLDDVEDLMGRVAPDVVGLGVASAIRHLNDRLAADRRDQARREQIADQQGRHEELARSARGRATEASARLSELCREARCETPAELDPAERRAADWTAAKQLLTQVEDRLRTLSAGATVATFAAEVEASDADAIGSRATQLDVELADLSARRSELDQAIGRETATLQHMDETARDASAARASEAVQGLLARIGSQAGRYTRLRLAAAVLRSAIDRYREHHQGPVLRRAGTLFAELTLGSFEGLRADLNDRDEAILVGVRPARAGVVGVGGMSEGTCDQLYLALKLAGLEQYLEGHPPLPFVVDDVLVNFDDARAVAALKILADLSRRTQVLFFTHHVHLVTLARDALSPDDLFVHHLGHPMPPTVEVAG